MARPKLLDRGELRTTQSYTIKIKNQILLDKWAKSEDESVSEILNQIIEKNAKAIRKRNSK